MPVRKNKILSSQEPKPFRLDNVKGTGSGVVICDHASNRVPASLKNLGLKKSDLARHIGWDIGAEDIGRHIARKLNMPAVFASYSRLVVDLNRAPLHRECVPEISDKVKIPANTGLTKKAWNQRLQEIYWPYQNEVGKQVDRLVKTKQTPLLLAVHSYTPVMGDVRRPWHLSLLWNKEEKIAKRLIAEIRKNNPSLLVGENEPYSLKGERFPDSTICRHAEARGLPYLFIEFRQDLINTKEKAIVWGDIFLQALGPVLEDVAAIRNKKTMTRKR